MKNAPLGFSELDRAGQLARSVADARALLAFASQTSRKLDPVLVKEITEAADALDSASNASAAPNVKIESEFWIKYDTLAVALAPVSAESIRHTEIVKSGKLSPACLPLSFAIIGLLLFIFLQAYSAGGTDLLTQQKAAEKSQSEKLMLGREISNNLERAIAKLPDAEEEVSIDQGPYVRGRPKVTAAEKSQQAERKRLDEEIKVLQNAVARNSDEIRTIQEKVQPVNLLLEKWYQPLTKVFGLVPLAEIYDAQMKTLKTDALDTKGGPNQASQVTSSQALANRFRESRLRVAVDRLNVEKSRAVQGMASMILAPLNLYAIPALLGVLGAMTFMLRSISTQLAGYSYLPSPRGVTMSRITLGMIGGVIGSLFSTSTMGNDVGWKSLPPLAIPFLFGYAVDVFFALLDKVVATFSSDGTNRSAR